jgi:hypothetical protein
MFDLRFAAQDVLATPAPNAPGGQAGLPFDYVPVS